jgi:DNA-binding transcriptional LysR family regulator
MNWGAFDLNLLIVFDAVMQERSVTRAGDRVGLSQPAVSHALARLRHMLKDELFIRTPQGMVPTPRAEQLAVPVRHALDELQHSLESTSFVPSEAARTFRIAVDNYAAVVIVGRLAPHCAAMAPGIVLDFRPSGTLDLVELLDRGDLDLAIGLLHEEGERFSHQALLVDEFVAVLGRGAPSSVDGTLSIERFAALPHLEITSSGDDTDFIDRSLAEHGLTRRIASRAPYLAAAQLLAGGRMIAVLRRRIAEQFVRTNPLELLTLPFASPSVETGMLWHRRLGGQPAHRWLRDMVLAVCRGL